MSRLRLALAYREDLRLRDGRLKTVRRTCTFHWFTTTAVFLLPELPLESRGGEGDEKSDTRLQVRPKQDAGASILGGGEN